MATARNSCTRQIGELEVAISLVYGNYKNTPDLKEKLEILSKAIPILRKILDLPADIKTIARPIKSSSKALYFGCYRLAEVDPRKGSVFDILSSFCHEMVHAQQYAQGRLEQKLVIGRNGPEWNHYWEGLPHRDARPSMNYHAYRNLPWEKEAFERQDGLAKQVLAEIEHKSKSGFYSWER